jgi:hypothetical protein
VVTLVGGGSCQAISEGVLGPPVVNGPIGSVERCSESAMDGLGAHTDLCDFVIMITGQLASFGLPWWRRAGRQTRDGVTPRCPP